jgi:hypothetical protein
VLFVFFVVEIIFDCGGKVRHVLRGERLRVADEGHSEMNPGALPALETIERFFSLIDSGQLFGIADSDLLRSLRVSVADALNRLLVWERPRLEAARGLMWPYQAFKKYHSLFGALAESRENPFWQQQAQFFMAFLPFPQQWFWLLKVEKHFADNPEVAEYLLIEQENIREKVRNKPQRTFRLRHFCQIIKGFRCRREKGILRVFAIPYIFMQIHPELLQQLSERYVLYVEPPMGIIFRHAWWRHYSMLADRCLFGIGSEEDGSFLRDQVHVAAIPLAHGDYLDDRLSVTFRRKKVYDIVFNATFDDIPRKRHEFMLTLLQHPLLQSRKALFLGRGQTENVERFQNRVRLMGLSNRVDVSANVPRSEVPRQLARCKMGVHLSLYENGCRSIYEYFRSDLPCVISSSMAGMNFGIFNSQTGMAVADQDFPRAIATVLDHMEDFQPRHWFLSHSGSSNSSRQLNEFCKGFFQSWGYDWQEDIVALQSSGASRYATRAEYEGFRCEFQWILNCVKDLGGPDMLFTVD